MLTLLALVYTFNCNINSNTNINNENIRGIKINKGGKMPITQTTVLGTSMIVLVGVTLFNICYSIYMAVLNHKQAKVKDLMIEQNKILERIEEKIK